MLLSAFFSILSLLFLSCDVFLLVRPVPVGWGSGCIPLLRPPPPQQVEGSLVLQNSMAFWEWDNASPPPTKPPKKSASASCLVCGGAACIVDTPPTPYILTKGSHLLWLQWELCSPFYTHTHTPWLSLLSCVTSFPVKSNNSSPMRCWIFMSCQEKNPKFWSCYNKARNAQHVWLSSLHCAALKCILPPAVSECVYAVLIKSTKSIWLGLIGSIYLFLLSDDST